VNRQGYYSAVLSTHKLQHVSGRMGLLDGGKAAVADIKAPDGTTLERPAQLACDSGSYKDMGAVALLERGHG
jgi:putative spermidine/putrescine transport system substrate-binding protein